MTSKFNESEKSNAQDWIEYLIQVLLEDIHVQGSPLAFQAAQELKDLGNRDTATLELIKVLDCCYTGKRLVDNPYHRSLRSRTVRSLVVLGDVTAVPVLQKALLDPSLAVFDAALQFLENIGSETVIPGLLKALEYYEKLEKLPGCVDRCQILIEALGRLDISQKDSGSLTLSRQKPNYGRCLLDLHSEDK